MKCVDLQIRPSIYANLSPFGKEESTPEPKNGACKIQWPHDTDEYKRCTNNGKAGTLLQMFQTEDIAFQSLKHRTRNSIAFAFSPDEVPRGESYQQTPDIT